MFTFIGFQVRNFFQKLKKEDGQAMVEYGLIIALIAVAVIATLVFLGPQIAQLFTDVGKKLPAAGSGT